MTDRALIERLRALSAWLQERNLDMEMPAGMIDPAEAADRLEALTGGGEEPVVWLTPGGDVTRSHTYAVEQSANDVLNYPKALYLSPPSGRGPGREEIEDALMAVDGYRRPFTPSDLLPRYDLYAKSILALFSSPSLGGEGKQEDTASRVTDSGRGALPTPPENPGQDDGFNLLALAEVATKAVYTHGFGFREVVGPSDRDGKVYVNFAWDDDRLVRAIFFVSPGEHPNDTDLSSASRSPTQSPAGLNHIGAAEAELGRYIYRRIEALMDATPGTPDSSELAYLAAIAAQVEEYGEEACDGNSLAPFPPAAPDPQAQQDEGER